MRVYQACLKWYLGVDELLALATCTSIKADIGDVSRQLGVDELISEHLLRLYQGSAWCVLRQTADLRVDELLGQHHPLLSCPHPATLTTIHPSLHLHSSTDVYLYAATARGIQA